MRSRLLANIAGAVLLWGCQPPCTPRSVSPMSNTIQRYLSPRIIDFNVEIGDCEPGHVPVPKARVIGPTGQTGTARVELDQREGDLRAGKWPRLAVGTIEPHPVEPGPSALELDFGTVTYRIGAEFVEVLDPPRSPMLPAFCRPPVRLEGGTVICRHYDASGGPPRVIEISDGGVTTLTSGSRLWATSAGHLITADGGLGWLRPGQSLSSWQPQATVDGEVLGLSSSGDAVVVLQKDAIETRSSTALSELRMRVPTRHEAVSTSTQYVASTDRTLFTSGYVRLRQPDGGIVDAISTETFEFVDGGLASLGVVEGGREIPLVARGEWYWTSDGARLRLYRVAKGPMTEPVYDVRNLGSCGGFGDKPGCTAGESVGPLSFEGGFLQCPFVDDGGVRFVSIKLYGTEIGDCEGNYAYLGDLGVPSDPDGYLYVIDLSPFVATAPYR